LARLETFADGVFAIAATLLVLDVRELDHWPSYVAYAVSFMTIGIMWLNHHQLMRQVGRVDRRFMVANLGLLMCIAFVPFPTRLLAEHLRHAGARDAALAYGATLTITAVFFSIVWFYAARGRRLLRDDADPRVVAGITRSYIPGIPMYLTATLIAFASPSASAILYLVIAAVYIFESSVFGGRADTV
jgi:TMEM175 potassium channel family protein